MLVIGLTGGIGAGKTTVANLFADLGIPIIDADVIARQLLQNDTDVYQLVLAHYGKNILSHSAQDKASNDKEIDRKRLSDIIFNNAHERAWLESVLHPAIQLRIEEQIACLEADYCIVVIPLLAEKGTYSFIQRILVVDARRDLQIDRVKQRDDLSKEKIKKIIAIQADQETRLSIADDIIINNGDIADLKKQVDALDAIYLRTAKEF